MVTMRHSPDHQRVKHRGSGGATTAAAGGGGSSRRSREAAVESADCRRHGYLLTDKTLGTGAYAKVRLARVGERKLERCPKLRADLRDKGHDMVAIKVISKKDAPNEYISKFMPREIDALRVTYKHPHLIQLYEVFRSDSRIYLVTEYAPNGDILSYINECVLETGCAVKEETARRLFKHIISGVSHCHQLNVVHRDLKCENILLDENDNVKISDFGFACRFPTNRCNMLSTFCGSYAYAAPEILSAKNYDGKLADIWSLGVVLYALVNGRLPFNDQNLNTLLEQTRRKLAFQPWVSLECADLIRKLLRTRPLTRLRMHEIISHPWLRKELNLKNMTPFPSSQAFLKVIQEGSCENTLSGKTEDKRDKLKEPTLVLKSNGETVRLDNKSDKKPTKDRDDQCVGKQQPQDPISAAVTTASSSQAKSKSKSPHAETTRAAVMVPPHGKAAGTSEAAAESSRMRNLYRRILRPPAGAGAEFVFEVVEDEREKERLIERRLRGEAMRTAAAPGAGAGKKPSSPPTAARQDAKGRTKRTLVPGRYQHHQQQQQQQEAGSRASPSPRQAKPCPVRRNRSEQTADEDGGLAGYATTLIPVNIRDRTVTRTRGGTPEIESRTRISYRLGLSPTPTPAAGETGGVSPGDRRKYSASEPPVRRRTRWAAPVTAAAAAAAERADFVNVHGKTQLWKRALRGTLRREFAGNAALNDSRLESPTASSPRASPVARHGCAVATATAAAGAGTSGSKHRAARVQRLLARRKLLHGVLFKPEPEVRTSELLDQLQKNLPLLNDVAA